MKKYLLNSLIGFVFLFILPIVASAATLNFDPSSTTVGPDGSFTVDVNLEAGSQQVASTDIYVTYDSDFLEVEQVTAGSYFPFVDPRTETSGQLYIAGTVTSHGDFKTGTGTVATITFQALQEGSTSVTFDCDNTVSDKSKIVQNDTGATNIIECDALESHAVTISSSATPSSNATSSSSSSTGSSSSSSNNTSNVSTLPQSGTYEDMISYALTGSILLGAGLAIRLLLKII